MNDVSLATREDAYRLLAACYYPPTPAFLEERCCAVLAEILLPWNPEAAAHAARAFALSAETSAEELSVQHARLFVGPFRLVAPPYGSYYLEATRTVMGETTTQVEAFYRDCGLVLADDYPELPDHITAELEFVSFLAFRQREAEAASNGAEAARLALLQRAFLERFLLPWLPGFTEAITGDGESSFYSAVAHCTLALVRADHDRLSGRLDG